jgi:hypothetical protein
MLDDNEILFLYSNDEGVSIHILSMDEDPEEKYKELVKKYKDSPYETEGTVIWFNEGWNADRVWSMDFEEELYAQTD